MLTAPSNPTAGQPGNAFVPAGTRLFGSPCNHHPGPLQPAKAVPFLAASNMVSLGVEENLPRTSAALRPLDEHFHSDRLVDPIDGFDRGQVHTTFLQDLGLRPFVNFQIKYSEFDHQAAPEAPDGL